MLVSALLSYAFLLFVLLAVDCLSPVVSNAVPLDYKQNTLFNDTAVIMCRIGYTANGEYGQIRCLENSTWTTFICKGR